VAGTCGSSCERVVRRFPMPWARPGTAAGGWSARGRLRTAPAAVGARQAPCAQGQGPQATTPRRPRLLPPLALPHGRASRRGAVQAVGKTSHAHRGAHPTLASAVCRPSRPCTCSTRPWWPAGGPASPCAAWLQQLPRLARVRQSLCSFCSGCCGGASTARRLPRVHRCLEPTIKRSLGGAGCHGDLECPDPFPIIDGRS